MNNANQPQYDKLEKLLTQARLPEPSPELKERATTEAARIWKQASWPYRVGFPFGLCPPQLGQMGWLSGSPFAPVATACPIVGR